MESCGIITPGSRHLLFRDAHSHLRLAIGYAGLRRFVAMNHGDIDIFYLYTELRSAKIEIIAGRSSIATCGSLQLHVGFLLRPTNWPRAQNNSVSVKQAL